MTDAEPVEILLVEDNPGDAHLTREAFDESSVETTLNTVADGIRALDFLYQRGDYADAPRPEVVLLDLNLPRKNGDDVLKEVSEDSDLRRIPIVILTSSEAEDDIVNAYENYANAFLRKPVDPFEFIEMIERFQKFWFSAARLPDREE